MHPTPRWFHSITIPIAMLIAVASTWPVAAHLSDHIIDGNALIRPVGPPNFWSSNIGADVSTTVWIVNWFLRALVTQPLDLFDANAFYPSPLAGARQEHMFATDLLGAPGALLGGPVFAHQTALLLCIALNAWAAAYVVARWTGSIVGALVAGMLFTVSMFHQGQLVHLQSLGTFYLPLLLFGLERFGATGAPRWAGIVGFALAGQILSGQYLGYMAMVAALVAALIVLFAGRPSERPLARLSRDAAWLGAAAIGSALVTLPFVLPYFELIGRGEIPDNSGESLNRILSLREYLPHKGMRLNGLASGLWLLATVGAVDLARHRAGRIRLLMLVGIAYAGAVLSLGPRDSWFDPWRQLSAIVPGFGSMREPIRFVLLPCLGLALLGGCGAAVMTRRLPRGGIFAARLSVMGGAAALALCGWSAAYAWHGELPLRAVPVGASIPEEYRVLARCGDGDPLVEVPMGMAVDAWRNAESQLMSVHHWLPLLNGRASYWPPEMERLWVLVNQKLLVPEALGELRQRTGVRWVLIHCAWAKYLPMVRDLCAGQAWAQVPARYFPDTQVKLFDLGRVEDLPRPVPRRVPPTPDCLTGAG